MNACKATSAEANGTGTLPCSSVNNAFGTNMQSFKGIGGLLDGGAQCCLGAPVNTGPCPKVLPFRVSGTHSAVLKGG